VVVLYLIKFIAILKTKSGKKAMRKLRAFVALSVCRRGASDSTLMLRKYVLPLLASWHSIASLSLLAAPQFACTSDGTATGCM
jgi:hypothetical protein